MSEDMEHKLSDREVLISIWRDLRAMQQGMVQTQKQLILVLVALAGGQIALKLVGSPPWVVISVYLSWVAGIFLLGSIAMFWRSLTWGQKLTRAAFIALLGFSVVVRTLVYHPGVEPAPWWFPVGIDILMSLVALALIITALGSGGKPWRKSPKVKGG